MPNTERPAAILLMDKLVASVNDRWLVAEQIALPVK